MWYVFGTLNYGYVDRIPGIGQVVTKFFHFNFVPLVPMQSYFVVEGSESGRSFRGKPLPMSGKSVFVGYLRGWGSVACVATAAISWFCLAHIIGRQYWAGFVGLGVGVLLATLAVALWNQLWMVVQGLFHIGSLGGWVTAAMTGRSDGMAESITLAANGLLVVYALTRLLNTAGRTRAVQLMEEMGYDRETAEEVIDERNPRRQSAASDDD